MALAERPVFTPTLKPTATISSSLGPGACSTITRSPATGLVAPRLLRVERGASALAAQ